MVNSALERTMVWGEVGTDFPDYPINRVGDWDVVEKGLIVILYRHWRKLRLEVRMHILHDLLTSKGPRPPTGDWFLAPIRETENHILMIETSRYLTNQLLHLERWKAGESPGGISSQGKPASSSRVDSSGF
jgi:hypothetical protein